LIITDNWLYTFKLTTLIVQKNVKTRILKLGQTCFKSALVVSIRYLLENSLQKFNMEHQAIL